MCLRPASGFGRRFLVNPGARLLLARAINGSVNGARSGCANTPALACDHILTCRCAFCYHAAPSGRRFHHRRRVRHLGRRRCRGIFGTVTATSHATALAAGHRTAAAGLGAPAPPADALAGAVTADAPPVPAPGAPLLRRATRCFFGCLSRRSGSRVTGEGNRLRRVASHHPDTHQPSQRAPRTGTLGRHIGEEPKLV
jgi:hypothetical protein